MTQRSVEQILDVDKQTLKIDPGGGMLVAGQYSCVNSRGVWMQNIE